MKKASIILAALLSCLLIAPTFAQARASEYIAFSTAIASPGDERGEVNIEFSVRTEKVLSKIGALKIEIYRSNGSYVTTIWGSTSIGLLSPKSGCIYAATYPYKGTPGVSYYAVVTLCAGTATDYDTREITTSTVRAPY